MRKLILIITSLLLLGSDCEQQRLAELDNGRMLRTGVELRQCEPLAGISGDTRVLPDAVDQWNTWADMDGVERTWFAIANGAISVEEGYVPVSEWNPEYPDQGEAGIAAIEYAEESGCITDCRITLSSDIADHRPTLLQVLRHEMGHCLGLDDDPGIDITVDLRSVMGRPIDPLGVLTPGDFELLIQ
jgi:predicted Zn-dependent protease